MRKFSNGTQRRWATAKAALGEVRTPVTASGIHEIEANPRVLW